MTPSNERRFYTPILDMVDALIIVLDPQGRFVGFNRACERVSGYSATEVYGRPHTYLEAPEVQQTISELVLQLQVQSRKQSVFVPHETIWITRDGQRRPIEWSMTAVCDKDGSLSYVFGTGIDVAARRQMEWELAEANRQVAQVKEAERLRLAQDLHDDAVQQLLGLSYQLAEMQRRATEKGRWSPDQRLEELIPGLEVVRGEIIAVAQSLRRLISSLRPPGLREMGLAEILEVYVAEWRQGRGRSGPAMSTDLSSLDGTKLPESVATCIFRLVQEGLWNVHKHASADNVKIAVRHYGNEVVAQIQDDGCGFHIPRHLFQFAAAGRFGFIGMQERVHAVDSMLSVWSKPDKGTDIQARIPLKNVENDYDDANSGVTRR